MTKGMHAINIEQAIKGHCCYSKMIVFQDALTVISNFQNSEKGGIAVKRQRRIITQKAVHSTRRHHDNDWRSMTKTMKNQFKQQWRSMSKDWNDQEWRKS